MRASVNENSESLREFRVVASVNVLFREKNLHPNSSFAFQWCHPTLIVTYSKRKYDEIYLRLEVFRWTLIISRTPSETFEKVKRSMEHVLISQ